MKSMLRSVRTLALSSLLVLGAGLGVGCAMDVGSSSSDITDVPQSDVERQSIGNCWLYAEASWVESMHLSATRICARPRAPLEAPCPCACATALSPRTSTMSTAAPSTLAARCRMAASP